MIIEVTRQDYLRGGDAQGIDWKALPITRDQYREERVKAYKNFRNTGHDLSTIQLYPTQLSITRPDSLFYEFNHADLTEKCSHGHFQLRNLVWATSHNEVVFAHEHCVKRWNHSTKKATVLIDCFCDHKVAPSGPIHISTLTAGLGVVVVGGISGEYAIKPLHHACPAFTGHLTHDKNGITNHMEVTQTRSGSVTTFASSNDQKIRQLDISINKIVQTIDLPWPCSTLSPNKRILAVVGDTQDTFLLDAERAEVVGVLSGHLDYSFAVAWSPNGIHLATGNQDKTTRIYDVRNLSQTLYTLPVKIGAVRSLRFHPHRGNFLAIAEDADFVHIVNTQASGATQAAPYSRVQTVNFFGEISGISFTPDGERLFIGNSDTTYGSIMQYERWLGRDEMISISEVL